MKSLLLLGIVLFGAEAESQEIQKLLAFARGLELQKVVRIAWELGTFLT